MKKYIKKHKGIAVLFMIAGVLNALIGVFSSYTMQYVTEIVANGIPKESWDPLRLQTHPGNPVPQNPLPLKSPLLLPRR